MSRDPALALLTPDSEFITCPACGEVVWQHRTDPITTRISLPSHLSTERAATMTAFEMLRAAADHMHLQSVVLPAEEACRAHFSERHPIRYWIWDRYHWDRVLRKWLW